MSNVDPSARHRPPRLIPERPFPPYSYVTGKFPHPIRDADGHSHGHEPSAVAPLVPEEWQQSEFYRLGVDLFNYGYYWEAHESWESLWHAAQRRGTVADFLKALIKLAAAGVKAREGRAEGVLRHAVRGRQLFSSVADGRTDDRFAGLSLSDAASLCDSLSASPQDFLNTSDDPVVIVLPAIRISS